MPAVTRYFVNRTNEVDRLNSALNAEGPEKDSFVVVHGPQGIGKTQLLAKYLRLCNYENIRIAYVDLNNKDYLGLISEIVEGLGKLGFEDLEKAFDVILSRSQTELGQATAERAQELVRAGRSIPTVEQIARINFEGPVTGRDQFFINGTVTINDPKIENIFNIHLQDSERAQERDQERITLAFQSCLSAIATDRPIALLIDHWEGATDSLKIWLNAHLLKWAAQFQLKRALIVLSQAILPEEFEDKAGILPLAIPPFTREAALEFWEKNELPMEEFDVIAAEIYSIPSILALEVGKRRLRQARR